MFTYLQTKTQALIESRNVYVVLFVASFLESIILPIPLEAILIPLLQARREKLWLLALLATLGCILGAMIGYAVGYFLFEQFGELIASWFADPQQLETIKTKMQQQGFWYVLSVGVLPIPFQLAMLAAGAVQYSFGMFILATFIARSLRYFGLALLVKLMGNQAESLFKKYKIPSAIVLTVLVIAVWMLT